VVTHSLANRHSCLTHRTISKVLHPLSKVWSISRQFLFTATYVCHLDYFYIWRIIRLAMGLHIKAEANIYYVNDHKQSEQKSHNWICLHCGSGLPKLSPCMSVHSCTCHQDLCMPIVVDCRSASHVHRQDVCLINCIRASHVSGNERFCSRRMTKEASSTGSHVTRGCIDVNGVTKVC